MAQILKSREPQPRSGSRGESSEQEARAWVNHNYSRANWEAQWPSSFGQRREDRLASANRDLHAFRQKDLTKLSLEREDQAREGGVKSQHPGRQRRVLQQEGEEVKGEGTGPASSSSCGAGRSPGRPARAQVSEPGWSAAQRVPGLGARGRRSKPRATVAFPAEAEAPRSHGRPEVRGHARTAGGPPAGRGAPAARSW